MARILKDWNRTWVIDSYNHCGSTVKISVRLLTFCVPGAQSLEYGAIIYEIVFQSPLLVGRPLDTAANLCSGEWSLSEIL